ncbi:hypothetical protein [Paraburkholderia saeva]|uniref:hypothetical protein n=1 Tax=Paraburkholderia saeva TaxID=2777537 RepID=UPI001E5D68D9|nr:hypothetical protein [Paraburkholderia saeva]
MPAILTIKKMCTERSSSPTAATIGLVCLASLSARAEQVVTVNDNVATGLTGAYATAPASSSYAGTPVSGHSGISASSAVSYNSFAPTTSNRAAMIAMDFGVSAGSTGSLLKMLPLCIRIE